MNIKDLGFVEERIVEAIVTTYNTGDSPNAAPIGVHTVSDSQISMNIHTTSDTFKNIVRMGGCVINVVFDPYLFVKTCLLGSGKGGDENEVSRDEISPAKNVNAPLLKDASAWLEAELQSHSEHARADHDKETEFSIVKCQVVEFKINKKYPVAVNRGLFAAIELAIAVSRGKEPDERYLKIMEKTLTPEEYKRIREFLWTSRGA